MVPVEVVNEIKELKEIVLGMRQDIEHLKELLNDRELSQDDKSAIDETLLAQKQGKLKSMKEVFG